MSNFRELYFEGEIDGKGLLDEIDRLRAEADSLRKDAERYRWLRQQERPNPFNFQRCISVELNDWASGLSERKGGLDSWSSMQISMERMDSEIDAAMGAKA